MATASKVRADVGARTLTGMTIIAAILVAGGAQRSWAQSPAPVIYAKALNGNTSAGARLENRVDVASTPLDQRAPITFDQFQGRSAASTVGAIELRPGAARASLGPAPAPVSRMDQPARPVLPMPFPAPGAPLAYVEPYAGPPYQVDGKWYVPTHEPNYDEVGIASWYGPTFHGKDSASGEVFDENAMTAAHPTLPIPSLARVTNLENGKSLVVRLNDRGPFVDDRIIDLSRKAGAALGMQAKGTAKVRVQYVGPAPAAPNSLPSQPIRIQATQVTAPAAAPTMPTQPASEPAPRFAPEAISQLAPVAAPQPMPAIDQRGYFLQAGSFADLGNAHAFRDKLRDLGPVSVTAVQVNGAEYYRVMVGPWASRTEAERAQGRLIEAGTKAIVIARLD